MGPILVVDDDLDSRLLLRDLLEQNGYHVISVGTGDLALRAMLRQPVSLIITDMFLPAISGFELAHRLWALGRALPPIIALSEFDSFTRPETRLAAEALGARLVLQKPVDTDFLLKWIAGALTGDGEPVEVGDD
jgi:CheY-like chemotaxis protein